MIPLANVPYDPDAPEGSSSGSQYINKKDLRWVLVILAILGLLFVPVWHHMRNEAMKTACKGNMNGIFTAVKVYSEQYDGLLPVAYTRFDGDAPLMQGPGAVTWASHLQLPDRASFKCPAAHEGEATQIAHEQHRELTYGLYTAMAGKDPALLPNLSTTALIAETSNRGANATYDPKPLLDSQGRPAEENGFLIGYDDDNFEHTADTRFVTRLAFAGTADGNFIGEDVRGRHKYIHVLYADGNLGRLNAFGAEVQHQEPDLKGTWAARWSLRR